jgi:DNA-binding CsgD family transcriptional regulator
MIIENREPAELWPRMLEKLQEVIGFDAGYIAATWGSAIEGRGAVLEHDEPMLKRNLGRYLAEIAVEEVAQYTDRARLYQEIWSPERQAAMALFREVLHPSGMKHMVVRVSVRYGNVAGFNLERRSATPFTMHDLRLVDVIAPFLHIVEVLTLGTEDEARLDAFAGQHHLTRLQRDYVAMASRGLKNAEIAELMNVSVNTVRNTLAKVFEKVGVSTRAELSFIAAGHDAGRSIVAPRPRLSQDGMEAFVARVLAASEQRAGRASEPSPGKVSRIVYTPPLTPETAPERKIS